jgi:hypothetical protein
LPLPSASGLPVIDACAGDLSALAGPAADSELEVLAGAVEAAGLEAALVILPADYPGPVPGRLRRLAVFDARDPGPALAALQRACERDGSLVGVAAAFGAAGRDPRLRDFAPLYGYCSAARLPLVVQAPDGRHLVALGVLARAYPALRVLCRMEAACPPLLADLLARFSNLGAILRVPPSALPAGGRRQLLFGSQGRPDYAAAVPALSALPRRYRTAVAADNARRLFGARLAGHAPDVR